MSLRMRVDFLLFVILTVASAGQDWDRLQPPPPFADIWFLNKLMGWSVGGGSVRFSTDGGRTWNAVSTARGSNFSKVRFLDSANGWVFGDTCLKTTDGGNHWSAIRIRPWLDSVIAPINPFVNDGRPVTIRIAVNDICFVDARHAWAVGGVSFQAGMPSMEISRDAHFGFIIGSTDGGAKWDTLFVGLLDTTALEHALYSVRFIDSVNGWAAGSKGRVFRTENGGRSWESHTAAQGFTFNMVDFFNRQEGMCVDRATPALFVSRDGGLSWSEKKFGPTQIKKSDVCFINLQTGWAVTGSKMITPIPGSIAMTDDSAATWKLQDSTSSNMYTTVDFLDRQTGWVGGLEGTLLHTADGGESWQSLIRPHLSSTMSLSAVSFIDGQNGWAAEKMGAVVRTYDGGVTWKPIFGNVEPGGTKVSPFSLIEELYFADSLHGWAHTLRTLFITNDGGRSWDSASLPLDSLQIEGMHFIDDKHGWLGIYHIATSTGGVLSTNDGGNTWSACQLPDSNVVNDVYFLDSLNGWALSGFNSVIRTRDGGKTWCVLSASASNDPVRRIMFTDTLHGWKGFLGKTISRTIDGGRNWESFNIDMRSGSIAPRPQDLFFADARSGWVITTDGPVFFSNDSGKTWSRVASATGVHPAISFPSDTQGWVVGDNGTVLRCRRMPDSETHIGSMRIIPVPEKAPWLSVHCKNRKVRIRYRVEEHGRIILSLFDCRGRIILREYGAAGHPGVDETLLPPLPMAQGVYILRAVFSSAHGPKTGQVRFVLGR